MGKEVRRQKDGSSVDIRLFTAGIRDSNGNIDRIMTIVEDITERQSEGDAHRFLAEASTLLGSSLDYQTTLANLAHLAISKIADWCEIDVVEGDALVAQVA